MTGTTKKYRGGLQWKPFQTCPRFQAVAKVSVSMCCQENTGVASGKLCEGPGVAQQKCGSYSIEASPWRPTIKIAVHWHSQFSSGEFEDSTQKVFFFFWKTWGWHFCLRCFNHVQSEEYQLWNRVTQSFIFNKFTILLLSHCVQSDEQKQKGLLKASWRICECAVCIMQMPASHSAGSII